MLVTRRGQRVAHYFATKQKRVQTSSQGWKPTYHKAKSQSTYSRISGKETTEKEEMAIEMVFEATV